MRPRHLAVVTMASISLCVITLVLSATPPVIADGIMLVQAGAFWMGRDDGPRAEAPLHRAFVRDVWIERHKVTNAEYAEFLNAAGGLSTSGERRYDHDDADARIHRVAIAGQTARWVADGGFERHQRGRGVVVRRARLLRMEGTAIADGSGVGEGGAGR